MTGHVNILGDRKKKKHIDDLLQKAEKDKKIKRVLEGEQRVPKKPEDQKWANYLCDRLNERGVDSSSWEYKKKFIEQDEPWQFRVTFELMPEKYYPKVEIVFFYECDENGWVEFSNPPEYKSMDNWHIFMVTDPAGYCEVHMYDTDISIHDYDGGLETLGKYPTEVGDYVDTKEHSMEEILCDIADFVAERVEYYEKHGKVEIPENGR